jgi:hypothetical protein
VLTRRVAAGASGRRVQALGSARVSIPAGKTQLVRVRLNRAARSAIRRRGVLRGRALVLVRRSGPAVRERRITLRLAR